MGYSRLEAEPPLETRPPLTPPPRDWPEKGQIELDEVSFRYSDDLPLVLKSLCVSINPAEKVSAHTSSILCLCDDVMVVVLRGKELNLVCILLYTYP